MIDPTLTATTAEMVAATGLSASYLGRLERDGIVSRNGRDDWPLVKSVNAIIGYLRRENRKSGRTEADLRLIKAKARSIELRNAKDEHQLVEMEEVVAVIDRVIGLMVSRLAGLPARCTRDVELRRTIEEEINAARQAVADECAKQAASLDDTGKAAA
jgi:phage terminase Nu1 subunit (DNA packaging protein)